MNIADTDLKTTFYNIETLLKAIFIVMSLFNLSYTLFVAFACSLIGVLRVCKNPQMTREYLTRVLMNNHGQNLLYILLGASGNTNYLYLSPIVLFFGFGVVEYIKIRYPVNKYSNYIEMIRNNKYFVFETRAKLEIIFFVYLVVTLPFDFFGKAIKLFLLGQLLILKYKMNNDFKVACGVIHAWVMEKIRPFDSINSIYLKATDCVYSFATRN